MNRVLRGHLETLLARVTGTSSEHSPFVRFGSGNEGMLAQFADAEVHCPAANVIEIERVGLDPQDAQHVIPLALGKSLSSLVPIEALDDRFRASSARRSGPAARSSVNWMSRASRDVSDGATAPS